MTGTHPTDTGPDVEPEQRWWLARSTNHALAHLEILAWGPQYDGCYVLHTHFGMWHGQPEEVTDLVPAVVQPEATPDTDDDEDQYPTHAQVLASAAAHGDQWAIDELAEERAAIKRVVDEWWDAHGVVVHASSPHPLDDLVTRLTARRSAGEA